MKRIALVAVVGLVGGGVAGAVPSGFARTEQAKGTMSGVSISVNDPVEVRHLTNTWEPKGTTGWISWSGPLVVTLKTGEITYHNASEADCAAQTIAAGGSHVIPAGSVFQAANNGAEPAEAYVVAFLPPGSDVKVEPKPAGC